MVAKTRDHQARKAITSAHPSGAAGNPTGRKEKTPSTTEKAPDTGGLNFTSPSEVPQQTVVKQAENSFKRDGITASSGGGATTDKRNRTAD